MEDLTPFLTEKTFTMENPLDFMKLITEGTFKAVILHAERQKIEFDLDKIKEPIIQMIFSELEELRNVLKEALEARMGAPMYLHLINVYCNSWAVKALKAIN